MGGLQKLEAVDLYCGCGGMSFVDHKTKQVQIQTRWAVDSAKAMCLSFEANYPDAKVSHPTPTTLGQQGLFFLFKSFLFLQGLAGAVDSERLRQSRHLTLSWLTVTADGQLRLKAEHVYSIEVY